ncbi:Gfo/Idh/MocA family protein [Paenibacillus thalictri]|uniref:Gfo/Idh/MocA family oxidoreductase n=1 Tax=Paenibacillus thalictri TaxID=2527873 RepID=A0A4Q9DHJ9_9BACL|nr:Gfo/Idh/MocA family oxidoreductase [Paenibacillus thalictri]TBL72418.1 Gfo/Idh/MocA family oxidoreductase [Paenibacillus thalictri]
MKLGVGLYGNNGGHQIHRELSCHPLAKVVAIAGLDTDLLTPEQQADPDIRVYETLERMLDDKRAQLISLCSPVRALQADEAILCMSRGKHVYAEKPCALNERDIGRLLETAAATGRQFREMAGTAFEQPYLAIRELVKSGVIGEVVQVFAQKSYPYHDGRPQDEAVDGGLIGQNGIHAVRFIEHVAGVRIKRVTAAETRLGNPSAEGNLPMAAGLLMELANGGVASAVVNYLNQRGMGSWGNDHLRIFGTKGFVESTDGGTRTRLVVGDEDRGPLQLWEPERSYLDMYIDCLLGKSEMPLPLEDELHCTRVTVQAKQSAAGRIVNKETRGLFSETKE